MKNFIRINSIVLLMLISVFFVGCGSSDSTNTVVLDGPILETVGRDGDFEFNGAVINISSEPVRSVFVVIILEDENGEIIEANSISVLGDDENSVLLPSESVLFSVSFKTDPSLAHSKDVEIYFDEQEIIN